MRGLVSIDWVIGIAIFLVFVSLAIVHTTTLMPEEAQPLLDSSGLFADRIMDSLLLDVQEVPVRHNSPGPQTNAVLYLDFNWPFGKNTTQVLSDTAPLPCIIQGSTLYWQANLTPGTNNFTMRFTDQDALLQCNGTFSTVGANQTIPWAGESLKLLSQDSINQMLAADYSTFRSSLNIDRNFRVELNISGTETDYGPEPPLETNVFAKSQWGKILETGESAAINILIW